MPANYPEQWLARVKNNIVQNTNAPWLLGIPELDTSVIEASAGTVGEANLIHVPISDFAPDVLINNSTYPLAVQAYTDDSATIALDKFQTKATSVSDDKVTGSSYQIIDNVTLKHSDAILQRKYMKAAHALAPSSNSAATPVIGVTGAGTEASGERLRMTYNDLVTLKAACDAAGMPEMDRRLVLCSDHWNDMLRDRGMFGDQMINYKDGQLLNIAGFNIYQYLGNPYYNGSTQAKLAFGATPSAGQYQASFVFWKQNVAIKTGSTKQYFKLASTDPENQANLLNYRHYFICLPFQARYIAALTSKNKA